MSIRTSQSVRDDSANVAQMYVNQSSCRMHACAVASIPDLQTKRRSGAVMLISRVGDWTSSMIDDPPTELYIRGVLHPGLPNLLSIYQRATVICTGAGLGPFVSTAMSNTEDVQLIWVCRDPEKWFSPELYQAVLRLPHAIVINTAAGRPDMVALAAQSYHQFGSEVVCLTSNPKATRELMTGLKQHRIPAFAPTWDS